MQAQARALAQATMRLVAYDIAPQLDSIGQQARNERQTVDGTGKVLRVIPSDNRVVVQGIQVVQRHTRPSAGNPQGGIVNKEASIHLSNVALVDSKGKPTRVGFRMDGDKKVRFAKTTGDAING